ncbi:MAG: hypothetical protein M0Q53_02515 [Prolixibacteraceae bacterium]|jgi:hypothetical protein|nr:hypothetical protein [Prolixibacteraceae bacterium]
MKTKDKIRSNKTLLEDLREIRDNLSLEMKDMTLDQIKDFLKTKKTLHPTAVWNKVG